MQAIDGQAYRICRMSHSGLYRMRRGQRRQNDCVVDGGAKGASRQSPGCFYSAPNLVVKVKLNTVV